MSAYQTIDREIKRKKPYQSKDYRKSHGFSFSLEYWNPGVER